MTRRAAMHAAPRPASEGFSLVVGGPLYQLLMRGRLCDAGLGLVRRRMIVAASLLWAPLVILGLLQSWLTGDRFPPLLEQIGVHLRFLVVVPMLIGAEIVVHARLSPLTDQFRVRGLLRPEQVDRFDSALAEARALRNSVWAELLLLLIVYGIGVPIMARRFSLQTGLWYAHGGASVGGLSLAGWWLVLVSLPLFQFLLCRWYFRLFIWAHFLWRMSMLDLDLDATHPDRAGGLGFLGSSLYAFVPLAAAHGILLAGVMADRILFAGATLVQFKVQIAVAVLLLLALFGGPITVFTPLLARVRRRGLLEFGALAQVYVRDFEEKWPRGGAPAGETLLGSSDIQSLADLANSYADVEGMRLAPVSRTAIVQFVAATVAPMLPLLLTMMSVEQLVATAAGMVI